MLEGWRKPRIEHPDPKVRAEAFAALEPDDPRYLAAVRDDDDLSVRVALIARLTDLALLGELHGGSAGAELAKAADTRLRALLEQAAPDSADSALLGSGDNPALLKHALQQAGSPALRRTAFERLAAQDGVDDALRESLASSAADAGLRALAVAALDDAEALERVAHAVRKSDKHVYRIAREKLAGQRAAAERAQRRVTLLEELSALASRPLRGQNEELHRRLGRLQDWQEAWRKNTQNDTDGASAESGLPPESAAQVAHIESLIAAARAVVEKRKGILDEIRAALTADGQGQPDLGAWQERWGALADHSDTEQREFDRALDALRAHGKDVQRQASLDARAQTLLTEWESTDWNSTPVDSKRVAKLEGLWSELDARGALDEALQGRYRALHDRLTAVAEKRQADAQTAVAEMTAMVTELKDHLDTGRSAEATSVHDRLLHRLRTESALGPRQLDAVRKPLAELDPKLKELHEWRRWGAQQARDGLCAEAEALTAQVESMKPGKLANRVKALRQKWQAIDKGVGPAPQAQWERFNTACETAYAPARALFEAQAAERKDNAAKKRAVCERLEEYTRNANWDEPDWDGAVKILDNARREWRDIGGVTPKQFARLRKRYRLAVAGLDDKLADERGREKQRREATIEQLRAGLESEPLQDQIRLAKEAQANWRPTVRLRRKDEQALWQTLRDICDQIFARREERFASRREVETEALTARRALCEQLAALLPGDSEPDDAAVSEARAEMSKLRKQWREAGTVAPKERAAVERRWRATGEALDAKLARHARRAAGKANETLLLRALLVADRDHASVSNDAEALAKAEAAWAELDEQRGDVARALSDAWSSGAQAGTADASDARRELCIRLEMLADVESPAEDRGQRMALKVAMLSQAMSGESQGGTNPLHGLLTDWAHAGAMQSDGYAELRERFAQAARKLNEAD